MKTHFCLEENTTIDFEGECNWCGEKEWQGLNMQEIGELSFKAEEQLIRDKLPMGEYAFEFYYLIEQALKEKNANNN